MNFDYVGCIIALCVVIWRWKSHIKPVKSWFLSSVELIADPKAGNIVKKISLLLSQVILFMLIVALANPQIPLFWFVSGPSRSMPTEGRVLLFDIDVSGSMEEPFVGDRGSSVQSQKNSKIEVAKKTLESIVKAVSSGDEGRQHLFGLSHFARASFVDCPLTYDQSYLLKKASELTPVQASFMDGTELGYALFKSIQEVLATRKLAQQLGTISIPLDSQAIIIITDGIEDPHPLDKQDQFRSMPLRQSLQMSKEAQIRVYFISVETQGDADFQEALNTIASWVEETKGRLFKVGPNFPIEQVVQSIKELESSKLPPISPPPLTRISLRWLCVLGATILLFLKLLFDLIVFRGCS